MKRFDYSFLENGLLPTKLVNMTSNIYSLRTRAFERKQNNLKVFSELENIAIIQSVISSNAIEGIVTSDERVREMVNKSSAPQNHNEAEIAGYRDALDRIHNNFDFVNFDEHDILQLHSIMFSQVEYDYGGKYKTSDNLIMEIDKSGNRKVRFYPVKAAETHKAMEQLVLAYVEASNNVGINPLLLIPCVILDFLCIHPFKDGNGRLSRLLSLLLLYKAGFDVGKYVSYEEQINKYKLLYYDALENSSIGWHENENNYFPFVENFLSLLYMCYKELDKRFSVVNGKRIGKSKLIEETVLNSLTPLSKTDICAMLPEVSPTTVEAVLGKMVKSESIVKLAHGRNTKYLRNK